MMIYEHSLSILVLHNTRKIKEANYEFKKRGTITIPTFRDESVTTAFQSFTEYGIYPSMGAGIWRFYLLR